MWAEPERPGLTEPCAQTTGFARIVAAGKNGPQAGDPERDAVPGLRVVGRTLSLVLRGSGGGGADQGVRALGHRQGEQGADGL